jgi:hypothetical protein
VLASRAPGPFRVVPDCVVATTSADVSRVGLYGMLVVQYRRQDCLHYRPLVQIKEWGVGDRDRALPAEPQDSSWRFGRLRFFGYCNAADSEER